MSEQVTEEVMSDKTNAAAPQPAKELPDKPGCWFQLFDNGIIEERWVVFGDNGYWCYFIPGQGEHGVACACQAGKWVKAIGPLTSNAELLEIAANNYQKWQEWRIKCGDAENARQQIHQQLTEARTSNAELLERAERAERERDDLMDLIRRSLMEHGDCKSGKRYGGLPKACTACMAQLKLKELSAAWKGRKVRLA